MNATAKRRPPEGATPEGAPSGRAISPRAARRAPLALLAGLALALGGCSSAKVLGGGGTPAPADGDEATTVAAAGPTAQEASGVAVGFCPKVRLITNDETYRTYQGRDRETDNIAYQAVLYDATRSCRVDGGDLILDVSVAGRLLAGPRGDQGGSLTMPIRVAVKDKDGVPYSELERFKASIAGGRTSDQFVYRRQRIVIPATDDRRTTILVGFDEGPRQG